MHTTRSLDVCPMLDAHSMCVLLSRVMELIANGHDMAAAANMAGDATQAEDETYFLFAREREVLDWVQFQQQQLHSVLSIFASSFSRQTNM